MKNYYITILKITIGLMCFLSCSVFLFAIHWRMQQEARIIKCRSNLDQFGKASAIYASDSGRNLFYPPRDGAGFLTLLYQENFISDYEVFLCPDTWVLRPDLFALFEVGNSHVFEPISLGISELIHKSANQLLSRNLGRGMIFQPIIAG